MKERQDAESDPLMSELIAQVRPDDPQLAEQLEDALEYYRQLQRQEEADRRRVPVQVIEMEERINAALNEPEFLEKVNKELARQEAKAARTRRPQSGDCSQRR